MKKDYGNNKYSKRVRFDGEKWFYNFNEQLVSEDELHLAIAVINGAKIEGKDANE